MGQAPDQTHCVVGGDALLGGYLAGTYPLSYQWYQDGQPVTGATHRWLQLQNLAATNAGNYTVLASNAATATMSDPINLAVSSLPYFDPALPVQQNVVPGTPLCVSVSAAGTPPLSFQSFLNGSLLTDSGTISGTATPSICFAPLNYADDGALALVETNGFGAYTGLVADLVVTPIVAWCDNSASQLLIPTGASNVVAVVAAGDHSLALRSDGNVVAWGDNTYGQNLVPAAATGVVALAEGDTFSLALKSDGSMVAWGDNTYGQLNVPTSAYGAVQIAAGTNNAEALLPNGTMVQWGSPLYPPVPVFPTNVVSISVRGGNSLALCADGSVIGWGSFSGLMATNAIAIAAGAGHGLALLANGYVQAWGSDYFGQTDVPASVSNIVAIAAGDYDSLALRADGTLISWGYANPNQPAFQPPSPGIMAIAAGCLHNLALAGQTITQTVAFGGSAMLSSGNLGSGLASFQWYYNGSAISGATNAALSLANLQCFNSGIYQVMVSNPLRVVAGLPISLVVPGLQFDPASFAYQPQSGKVTMRLFGNSGASPTVIYASSNLVDWQAVFTNATPVNPIEFTDTPPADAAQRFYRASQ